ncbi:CPBP family intramembrane metalloprotease [Oscillatoria amoena NRMC-F 0135]|nr:CPBP family intramembrane metalloprotease [Oscillatoria amoena NRMC-F 0135]
MRKILNYLTNHLREDFNPIRYGLTFLFLALSVYLNYRFDFEDSFLDTQPELLRIAYYFLTHCVAYFIPVAFYVGIQKNIIFHSRGFWVRSLMALFFLSIYRSLPYLDDLIRILTDRETQWYAYKIGKNIAGVCILILPFLLFYRIRDTQLKHRYGLNAMRFDFRPYFLMLLLMVPLIAAASFLPDFQEQYPRYEANKAHLHIGVAEWVTALVYELSYGLNFVSIEFFYRGFLVIGMMGVLGRGGVLAMASLYCFLHFGKPMGEAISSIFGGFILGTIAYQTRSIWGGVIVHVGIAWLMELAAFVQQYIRNH